MDLSRFRKEKNERVSRVMPHFYSLIETELESLNSRQIVLKSPDGTIVETIMREWKLTSGWLGVSCAYKNETYTIDYRIKKENFFLGNTRKKPYISELELDVPKDFVEQLQKKSNLCGILQNKSDPKLVESDYNTYIFSKGEGYQDYLKRIIDSAIKQM